MFVGFCHVVFRESRSVYELLKHCTRQQRSTIDYFLHIHMSPSTTSSRANRLKPVCIITVAFSLLDDCECLDSSCTMEYERKCICNASGKHLQ